MIAKFWRQDTQIPGGIEVPPLPEGGRVSLDAKESGYLVLTGYRKDGGIVWRFGRVIGYMELDK